MSASILTGEEKVIMALRSLYESYGYSRYKMSKFEEYDLYARNKDFLVSDNIITFTETNGRLMALKPDVTLSIVRSGHDDKSSAQKLYYNENVYRVSDRTHSFREIMQTGLECIGDIDDICLAEVLTLAAKSLREISEDSMLVISHLGIVSELLSSMSLKGDDYSSALRFIGEKNTHELERVLKNASVPEASVDTLLKLVRIHSDADEVLSFLRSRCSSPAVAQLERLTAALESAGCGDMIRLDFSVVNNMRYYNGIVFKGYVSGIPVSVLSGGQYDRLMKKLGRSANAVGFAVYLDTIERLNMKQPDYDVDTVLLYKDSTEIRLVLEAADRFRDKGSVITVKSVPAGLRYRQLAVLSEDGTEVSFRNA